MKGRASVDRYFKSPIFQIANELVYIYRRNNFRSSMEEDAVLDFIIPSVAPRLSMDGELVETSETMDLLRLAVDLLPEEWE